MKHLFLLALVCWLPFNLRADEELSLPSDETTLKALREVLSGKSEFIERKAKRLGNKTLEVDCYLSIAGDYASFKKIATDYAVWRDWGLLDINLPQPGHGDYILQLHDLLENTPKTVTALFSFNIPFFKEHRARSFAMTMKQSDKALLISGETIPAEKSAVRRAKAFMHTFPAEGKPGNLWINVKALVLFNSWLFYEALPEKVVLREVGDRLQYIAQNYQREENRRKENLPLAKRHPAGDVKIVD